MSSISANASITLPTTSLIESDLTRDEGIRPRPYRDTAGHLTIGVGHNLDAAGLCPAAILAQLKFDIEVAKAELGGVVPDWQTHPEAVQRALINLTYNLGGKVLSSFNGFLGLLAARQYVAAADDLLTTAYASQVGQRAWRIATLIRGSSASA